jgi:hypothetical protein
MTSEGDIRRIVRETVRETLTMLGLDVSSPRGVIETQADHAYLRKSRKGAELVGQWSKRALVGAGIGAALYLLWEGFKAATRIKGGP